MQELARKNDHISSSDSEIADTESDNDSSSAESACSLYNKTNTNGVTKINVSNLK